MSTTERGFKVTAKTLTVIISLCSIMYTTYNGVTFLNKMVFKIEQIEGYGLEFNSYKKELGDELSDVGKKLDRLQLSYDQLDKLNSRLEEFSREMTETRIAIGRLEERYTLLEKGTR